jgi:hypothetical protein
MDSYIPGSSPSASGEWQIRPGFMFLRKAKEVKIKGLHKY